MTGFHEVVEYCKKCPSLPLLVGFGATFSAYYLLYVVRRPVLTCKNGKLKNFLLLHCPVLKQKYWPTFWCFESRAQTIIRSLIKTKPRCGYQSEYLATPDDGEIKLDWFNNDNSKYPDPSIRPTILILPGLTGCSEESYVLHFVQEAADLGYRSVVFNNRGNGGAQLKTPRTYCAANIEDMSFVVSRIKQLYPESPLIGTGISLGGMILFNYLVKTGRDCGMVAGMCFSVPWNVFESSKQLEQPINNFLFNRFLARNLCDAVRRNFSLFEQHFDMEHVLGSATIRDFDERFTSKMFGYSTCDDYYKEASLHDKVHHIEVPLFCLNAADDPFSPYHAIPINDAQESENVAIAVTSHGGHIGFLEGVLPYHTSYMDRVFKQFVRGIFEHGLEKSKIT